MSIGTLANSESGSSCRAKLNQALSLWDGMVGAIIAFAGASAPSKWLICDGSAVSRTTYSELFSIIGETYGVGDSSTTFNLPNLKGRVAVGIDEEGTFPSLGLQRGNSHITLSQENLPNVNLTTNTSNFVKSNNSGIVYATSGSEIAVPENIAFESVSVSLGGVAQSIENDQPSLTVNYIIYTGV